MSNTERGVPGFDAKGNLRAGVYEISLREMAERFAWNGARRRLFRQFECAAANLAEAGVRWVWVGGSFVTAKEEPNDIDGCWEDGPWVDKGKLDPAFLDPHDARGATRRKYGLDFQVAGAWLLDVHKPVEAFLQRDKDGNRRGILRVRLGETQ